jgi:hypothetical protein
MSLKAVGSLGSSEDDRDSAAYDFIAQTLRRLGYARLGILKSARGDMS